MTATRKRTDDGMFREILSQVDDRSQFINRAINSYLERAKLLHQSSILEDGHESILSNKNPASTKDASNNNNTSSVPSFVECAVEHSEFKNIIGSHGLDKSDNVPMVKKTKKGLLCFGKVV